MPSLESDVMRSLFLVADVVKETVVSNIQASAARGDFELTNDAFEKINRLVRVSVDQAVSNGSRQMQSAVRQHSK